VEIVLLKVLQNDTQVAEFLDVCIILSIENCGLSEFSHPETPDRRKYLYFSENSANFLQFCSFSLLRVLAQILLHNYIRERFGKV